jgi:hypothetical protein
MMRLRSNTLFFLAFAPACWTFALGGCGRYSATAEVTDAGSLDSSFDQGIDSGSKPIADADAGTLIDAARGCELPDLLKGAGSMNSPGFWIGSSGMVSFSGDAGLNGSPAAILRGPDSGPGIVNGYFSLQTDRGVLQPSGQYRLVIWHRLTEGSAIFESPVVLTRLNLSNVGQQLLSNPLYLKSTFDCTRLTTSVIADSGADQYIVPQVNPQFRGLGQGLVIDELRLYNVPAGAQFPTECDCPP